MVATPILPRVVWLMAGEASGDILGARLMEALNERDPSMVFVGIGGSRMEALGLTSLFPMQDLSVMGFLEIIPRLRLLSRRLDEAVNDVTLRQPDLIITIDSPGFSLRFLKRVRHLNIPRIHYVGPQVWAWREGRARHFPILWDKLLCLLPFEQAWFSERGIEAQFVGHPVLQSGADYGNAARFRHRHSIAPDAPILVLMPGSRKSEVPRLLPVYGRMLALLKQQIPNLCPVVPISPLMAHMVRDAAQGWPMMPYVITDLHDKHDAFAAAGAALTKSGTSTLELALAGVPMVVAYRVNPITAFFARHMIKVSHVAIVNLLAGCTVVPELLQESCTPERLSAEIAALLTQPERAAAQRKSFTDILAQLRPPADTRHNGTPAAAAAVAVLDLLEKKSAKH